MNITGFELQNNPKIYLASIPGKWLLNKSTPSWRIDDPQLGFQRLVKEARAREIALTVLDQKRTFPNAIVLATDKKEFEISHGNITLPEEIKFLVVDGQHRLYAQKYSEFDAKYACVIHMGLSEIEMARLFLEINDNQKRVPSSLRWDLVRLVRPEDDPTAIASAEIVYSLATEKDSPLYQRIDLTGEQNEIQLKQGSIAPAIRFVVNTRSPLNKISFDLQYNIILQYFIALREVDKDWGNNNSYYYKARVITALLRLLPEIYIDINKEPEKINYERFISYLKKIKKSSLDPEKIRSIQGSAGMKAIYLELRKQIF